MTEGHGEPWTNPKISPEENPTNAPNIISFFIFYELRGVFSRRFASLKNGKKCPYFRYFERN